MMTLAILLFLPTAGSKAASQALSIAKFYGFPRRWQQVNIVQLNSSLAATVFHFFECIVLRVLMTVIPQQEMPIYLLLLMHIVFSRHRVSDQPFPSVYRSTLDKHCTNSLLSHIVMI